MNVALLVTEYNTGERTIKQLALENGISTGKMYYILRDNGCVFSRKRRTEVTDEERLRRSEAQKGRTISEEGKQRIREANACNYNGLNGYGHTKAHNKGYVLVYVPKHPNAHIDGYVMFHTVLMERAIGRYLTEDEVVHHINHNRKDNRLENLMLMDKKEHMAMHMRERHAKEE